MWNNIKEYFQNQPEKLKVARVLIENGLSIRSNKIYLNQIEVQPTRVARVAEVDRRTVKETLNAIESSQELKEIFKGIKSAGYSLKDIAKSLGLGVLEITPVDAKMPGILSGAALVLANNGLSVRQAIADDPELSPEPKLTLIIEKKIPGLLIPEFLKIKGVAKISVY
ncbi:amino acid-binding protein [Candidatus Bathyarchaeota archaeon]|nr:amino acid-binding protein [Candidatus Bathyarchaeota archaeon]